MVKHIPRGRQVKPATSRSARAERTDLGILLALAYSAFATELRAFVKQAGYEDIHPSFGYVARNLDASPLTLTELAERLDITAPGALKIVQAMEDTGYLERRDDPNDARAKRLYLTKRGDAALATARSFHAQFESKLAKRLSATDVKTLRAVLEDIVTTHEASSSPLTLRQM